MSIDRVNISNQGIDRAQGTQPNELVRNSGKDRQVPSGSDSVALSSKAKELDRLANAIDQSRLDVELRALRLDPEKALHGVVEVIGITDCESRPGPSCENGRAQVIFFLDIGSVRYEDALHDLTFGVLLVLEELAQDVLRVLAGGFYILGVLDTSGLPTPAHRLTKLRAFQQLQHRCRHSFDIMRLVKKAIVFVNDRLAGSVHVRRHDRTR